MSIRPLQQKKILRTLAVFIGITGLAILSPSLGYIAGIGLLIFGVASKARILLPRRGEQNMSGGRIYGRLAEQSSLSCPQCGASAEPSSKFCGECGSQLR